jgi:hypothetical protein
MRTRPYLAWILAGLLGLALAAGISYAATQLSSQRIGLAAEPPSVGEELAPATRPAPGVRRERPDGDDRGAQRGGQDRDD